MGEVIRCSWANPKNHCYIQYHDEEWGVPVHDDQKLFEMLILENFQAGLSWECILNKREAFRQAFDGFALEKGTRIKKVLSLQNDISLNLGVAIQINVNYEKSNIETIIPKKYLYERYMR